jgi:hypothetical protein
VKSALALSLFALLLAGAPPPAAWARTPGVPAGEEIAAAWLPDGRAAIVAPETDALALRFSADAQPRTLADFSGGQALFGAGGRLDARRPGAVRLAVAAGSLQLFYALDGRLHAASASLPVTAETRWETVAEPLPGEVRLQAIPPADGAAPAVLVLQHEAGATGSTLYRAWREAGKLRLQRLVQAPDYVASADARPGPGGDLHLAWSEAAPERPVRYRVFRPDGSPAGDALTVLGGQHPAVLPRGGQALLAVEDIGGGIAVRWIESGRELRRETLGGRMALRPAFAEDGNGVAWLFVLDGPRRALWYRRLLGRDFGAEATAYGVSGRWEHDYAFALPGRIGGRAPGFPILHEEDLPEGGAPRCRFDLLPVPRLAVSDDRRVQFLDLLEVAEVDNAVQRLGLAEKSDANPLALNGPAGSADEAWVNYADVMYDQGRFRMWYTTNTNTFERNWNLAYAESADGIRWTKPNLGLVPFHGSKENNLLFPNFADPAQPPSGANSGVGLVRRDDADPDPARRYKMLFMSSTIDGDASIYLTWSADGIHWDLHPTRLWGKGAGRNHVIRGQTPWVEPLSTLLHDPLEPRADYRWKLYGIDAYTGHPQFDPDAVRSLGMVHGATPYDFAPYPGNPILDPRTGVDEDQNHGGLVQVYEGMYVGIYQHWFGPDWNVDLRLAASRDGIHFTRIQPDRALLPLGPTGAWDSGMLCTPNALVARDDRLWLYYRGSVGTLATGRALSRSGYAPAPKLREPWRIYTGLARLRRDGFACLTVAPLRRAAADRRYNFITDYDVKLEARVRTIPIDAAGIGGRTLHVNVGSLAPRFAWLKAQLRDAATGAILPGYDFAACDPCEEDRLDHTFTWKGSASLAAVRAARVEVEFLLFGTLESPRLHSFWFK